MSCKFWESIEIPPIEEPPLTGLVWENLPLIWDIWLGDLRALNYDYSKTERLRVLSLGMGLYCMLVQSPRDGLAVSITLVFFFYKLIWSISGTMSWASKARIFCVCAFTFTLSLRIMLIFVSYLPGESGTFRGESSLEICSLKGFKFKSYTLSLFSSLSMSRVLPCFVKFVPAPLLRSATSFR